MIGTFKKLKNLLSKKGDVMYTFYIGQYVEGGLPALTYIESCKDKNFEQTLNQLIDITPYGMDIYIQDARGIIWSYYREIKNNRNLLK